MTTKTSTNGGTRKYLIWSSVAVLAGIGIYFGWKKIKNNKSKSECEKKGGTWDEVTKTCVLPVKIETPASTQTQTPVNTSTETYPATGLSQSDGDAFRAWVNEKYPDYAKKVDLSKTGAPDNTFIRKAYAQYGTEWKNSKSGKTTILPTNADSFNKLASSIGTPIYLTTDGRRVTRKDFTIKGASSFDILFGGTWKIEFYEQASVDPSKQSYRIVNGFGKEFQNGYWSNNGKTLVANNGTNKGTSSTTDTISKTIGNVVGKDILWT